MQAPKLTFSQVCLRNGLTSNLEDRFVLVVAVFIEQDPEADFVDFKDVLEDLAGQQTELVFFLEQQIDLEDLFAWAIAQQVVSSSSSEFLLFFSKQHECFWLCNDGVDGVFTHVWLVLDPIPMDLHDIEPHEDTFASEPQDGQLLVSSARCDAMLD